MISGLMNLLDLNYLENALKRNFYKINFDSVLTNIFIFLCQNKYTVMKKKTLKTLKIDWKISKNSSKLKALKVLKIIIENLAPEEEKFSVLSVYSRRAHKRRSVFKGLHEPDKLLELENDFFLTQIKLICTSLSNLFFTLSS